MSMSTPTATVTNVAAGTTMGMSMHTAMVTNVAAATTTATSMHTATVTNVAAATTTAMSIAIMCPDILMTASVKFVIRMKNIAMCAAKALLTAPAVCRMQIR